MSCALDEKRILIGKTSKGAIISICKNCQYFSIPHFNYEDKKREITFSLLSNEFVEIFENIDLDERTDVEEFLNTIVTPDNINKTNKLLKKLNRQFFKQQKRNIKRFKGAVATIEEGDKYYGVDVANIETDMSNWELVVKMWNKYNDEKTSKNLCKPYYRNFQEYIDISGFSTKYDLQGAKCFTRQDQEREPHFIYKLATGEEFAISFTKPNYLQPIPRLLTQSELNNLVKFLNAKPNRPYLKDLETNWQVGCWTWNDQNYDFNGETPNWFPKYKKITDDAKIPDYSKLNHTINE